MSRVSTPNGLQCSDNSDPPAAAGPSGANEAQFGSFQQSGVLKRSQHGRALFTLRTQEIDPPIYRDSHCNRQMQPAPDLPTDSPKRILYHRRANSPMLRTNVQGGASCFRMLSDSSKLCKDFLVSASFFLAGVAFTASESLEAIPWAYCPPMGLQLSR